MIHLDIHKSNICSKRQSFQPPPHSSSPPMMANPTNLPTNENPNDPAGPPPSTRGTTHMLGGGASCATT